MTRDLPPIRDYHVQDALKEFRPFKQAVRQTLKRSTESIRSSEQDENRLRDQELRAWDKFMKALGE